jgi:hypothetical protein
MNLQRITIGKELSFQIDEKKIIYKYIFTRYIYYKLK